MKIDAQVLKRFIKKSSLNGTMMTMKLDFREDGLYSKLVDPSNFCLTEAFLPASAFEDYQSLGEIYVKNTLTFRKYVDTFGSDIEIEKIEEFAIKITDDTREAVIIMGGKMSFDNDHDGNMPSIELSSSFRLKKQDLDRTYKDFSLIQESSVLIERNKDNVSFIVGNQKESDNFKNIVLVEESETTSKVRINYIFKALFESLDGEFTAYLEDNKPLLVVEETDGITFKCIIAPMTEI